MTAGKDPSAITGLVHGRTVPVDVDAARSASDLEQRLAARTAELEALRRALRAQLVEGRRLAAIVESSNDAIIGMSLDGSILSFNKGAQRIYGYMPQEVLGRPVSMLLPAECSDELVAALGRIQRGETVEHYKSLRRRKDGVVFPVSVSISPVFDEMGSVVAASTIGRDITAQEELEAAARESQNRLQLIADALPVLIAYVDTDRRYRFNNAAFERWHGIPCAAFQGQRLVDMLGPGFHAALLPHIEAALAGEPQTFESRLPYADGKVRDMEIHYIPHRDERGNVLGFYSLGIDVSERRRLDQVLRDSEDRLRAIVLTAADAIVTWDEHGIIESVNPAAERMFGYAAPEMIGQSVSLLLALPFRAESDSFDDPPPHTEALGRHKGGTTFPLEMTVSAPGRFRHITAILRDISRRRRLQREVLDIAALEQRRIGQELHDNTGQELTALGLLAETLVELLPDDAVSAVPLAGKIVAGLKRALAQIRSLSRGLIPVEVDAAGLMAALKGLAARAHGVQGVQCTFVRPDPVLVENNQTATHLYRIAQEAVANALRHSRAQLVTIGLEETEGAIVLQVQDDGNGLADGLEESQGMGLKIMRHRADLINAQLTIEPATPCGTIVRCKLEKDGIHAQEKREDGDSEGEGRHRR